jgi:hypothetical protein
MDVTAFLRKYLIIGLRMLFNFASPLLDLLLDLLPAQKGLAKGDYLCADGKGPATQGGSGPIGRFCIDMFWHLTLRAGRLIK